MAVMRLSILYPSLSTEEREALAKKAEISSGYLYQLATRWQGKTPTVAVMVRLSGADERLTLADMVAEFGEPQSEAKPTTEARA